MHAIIVTRKVEGIWDEQEQEIGCKRFARAKGWEIAEVISLPSVMETLPDSSKLDAALGRHVNAGCVVVSQSVMVIGSRAVLSDIFDAFDGFVDYASVTEPFDTTTEMGRIVADMLGVWETLPSDARAERGQGEFEAASHASLLPPLRGRPPMGLRVAPSVARAKELKAQGLTLRAIAEQLNAEGIPTASGGKWWTKTVISALRQGRRPTDQGDLRNRHPLERISCTLKEPAL